MPEADKLKVFSVVVTYNGMRWAEKCIHSIVHSNYKITPVFIDNGSTDGTVEYIKSQLPSARFFLPDHNIGFGPANNLGIKYALENGADYILLCNQDVWFDSEVVGELIEVMAELKDFAILSPVHLNNNEKIDPLFLSYAQKNRSLSEHLLASNEKKIFPVPFVNAAFWLMDAAWLKKVGGFNPVFFMYGEDDNFCSRTKFYHGLIGICNGLSIIHDRGERIITPNHQKLIFRMRLRNKFFDINNRWPIFSCIKFTLLHMLSKKSPVYFLLGLKEFFVYYNNKTKRRAQYVPAAFINE